MGHMIELVVLWLTFAIPIGVLAGVAGLIIRAVGRREWTTISVIEGAFAIGVVMGFVVMLFVELAAI